MHHAEGAHQKEEGHAHAGGRQGIRSHFTPINIAFIAVAILILIVGVYFRTSMLQYYGFYEPDGFYHYSVIRAAVNHGFVIPHTLSISGWPGHTPVLEPFGLYWTTLLPYFFLRFVGVSYYTIERNIAWVFGLLDILGAYLLSRYLSKDKLFGILVMFFMALSGGDQARTSALIYRGDSFITIFLILALVALVEIYRSKSAGRKLAFAMLAAISLALSNFVWNGAPFATVVYIVSLGAVVLFAFAFDRKELIEDSKYVVLSLFIWFLMVSALILNGNMAVPQTFTGLQFFLLYLPFLLFWAIAYMLTRYRQQFFQLVDRWYKRLAILAIYTIVAVIVIVVVFSSFIYAVFVGNGFITTAGSHSQSNFSQTIQELQPPTPSFLYASFANSIYASPSMIILLAASYVAGHVNLFYVFAVLLLGIYLFMRVYDSGGFFSGNARIRFDFDAALLALISYYAITIYLQMHAIRFNSLISVPVAIFSAYTLYWLVAYIKQQGRSVPGAMAAVLLALVIAGSVAIQIDAITSPTSASWNVPILFGVGAFVLLIFSYAAGSKNLKLAAWALVLAFSIAFIYMQTKPLASDLALFWMLIPASVVLVGICVAGLLLAYLKGMELWWLPFVWIFIFALLYYNVIYTAGLVQADGINPLFFQALNWMKNNTPSNSVVLTLWPDGSVVEGVANRTSVTDSVGSQNYTKADPFAAWLFNSSPDPRFLTGPINGKPNYLLVRNTWMEETSGILTEAQAKVNYNPSNFTYVQFLSFSENTTANAVNIKFESGPQGTEIAVGSLVIQNLNGTRGIGALLAVFNQTTGREMGINQFRQVIFYNQTSGQMQVINQTAIPNISQTSYSLLMMYSGIPRQGAPVNITQAYAVNNGLANSNMFKFLFLCSTAQCPWDNKIATLQLVYQNADSKIFKINYNQSS